MKTLSSIPEAHRQELLQEHYPLVRLVANSMSQSLPSHVDRDELHSVGVGGLMAAVDRYDAQKADTFKSYACLRIKGAILDELRRLDTLPRTRRAQQRALQQAVTKLEQQLGRTPTDAELAEHLHLSATELGTLRRKTQATQVVSLDEPGDHDHSLNWHECVADERETPVNERLEHREKLETMANAIGALPERQQKILALYYDEGLLLSEIASLFEVSEARICQLHTQALRKLRAILGAAAA